MRTSTAVRAAPLGSFAVLYLALPAAALAQDPRRGRELPLPPMPVAEPDDWPGEAGYEDGFYLAAPSGSYRIELGGLLQLRATAFEGGLDDRASGADVERGRLELSGLIEDKWHFRFDPNFKEGGHELEEGWVGTDQLVEGAMLSAGRTREPFGLEENLDLHYYDFASYSLLNQFSPQQDDGLTLRGGSEAGPIEYGLGAYKDTGGGRYRDDDDLAGRLRVRPFRGGHSLHGLQLGLSSTVGRTDQDIAGEALVTESLVPFSRFAPGSRTDGSRLRLGGEVAWTSGPWAAYAEVIQVRDEVQGTLGSGDADTSGFYVGGSWVVTGEAKSNVAPIQPLRPTFSGANPLLSSGAWQLAARYSTLALDETLAEAGLLNADPALGPVTHPDQVDSLDLGVNWYASQHLGVKLHWIHTEYARSIELGGEPRDSEDALLLQLQLQF